MSEEEKLQLENECLLKYSKAQMIKKYIDELEENVVLSDLWCKSQEKIKEVREILNTQLAFTSSYQLNYQSAMSIIEEAKSTLRGVDKN